MFGGGSSFFSRPSILGFLLLLELLLLMLILALLFFLRLLVFHGLQHSSPLLRQLGNVMRQPDVVADRRQPAAAAAAGPERAPRLGAASCGASGDGRVSPDGAGPAGGRVLAGGLARHGGNEPQRHSGSDVEN